MDVDGSGQADSDDWDTGNFCDPCLIDNVNENALCYCTDCDEFLCDPCGRNHRKYKAFRKHQYLDRDVMPRKKMSNNQDKFCDKHDGGLIVFFCDKHDTCCCSACVTLGHSQCDVEYINELAKGYSSSQEYELLIKQISEVEKEIAEDKSKKQNDSIDITNCFKKLKADIEVFRSEINSKIDAFESELMQQAEQIQNKDLKAIESMMTQYDKLLEDMSEMSSKLGLLDKCKQNPTLFIVAKKAQNRMKEHNDKVQNMLQENIVRKFEFSRNDDILGTLNSHRKFGSLKVDRRSKKKEQTEKGLMKEENPITSMLVVPTHEARGKQKETYNEGKPAMKTAICEPKQAKFVKDINIKHKKDTKSCWKTGSVLLSNHLLALADRSNDSIKVVNLRSDTIKRYIKLEEQPWDITCMDPETLVVTCDKNLVFLGYNKKLSIVKKVKMDSGCRGISFRKGKFFVTFDGKHPSVKILNHEGHVLQTFKQNDQGHNLFRSPLYILVNSDGDTMYVSDGNKDTVTSLNMDGKVCSIYRQGSLSGPDGLTLGDDESIYVAGCQSRNIHQITPTCTHLRIVLETMCELKGPLTLLFNNTDKTLYVSNGPLSDRLSVYKLE